MHTPRLPLSTRAASLIAAAALTAGGVSAVAAVASAAPKPTPTPKVEATTLRISNKVVAHNRHHVDSVTGTLKADGVGVAGETVSLQARWGKHPTWQLISSATTGANGTVTFTVAGTKVKVQVQLVFAGNKTYRASHSNVVTLLPVR